MARTMTDELLAEMRKIASTANPAWWVKLLLAELDAERDAHNETNALLKGEIKAHAQTQERLKLAEAVCELAQREDWTPSGAMDNALAAWRSGK